MHLLGKAKQSQSTRQETEYVADTDIKCSFLMEYYTWITKGTEAYYRTSYMANKVLFCNILF